MTMVWQKCQQQNLMYEIVVEHVDCIDMRSGRVLRLGTDWRGGQTQGKNLNRFPCPKLGDLGSKMETSVGVHRVY